MSEAGKNMTPEMERDGPVGSPAPRWKRLLQITSLLLIILGLPVSLNLLCVVPFLALSEGGNEAIIYGVISLLVALLTVGVGSAAFLHTNRSLDNKPSRPLRFPPPLLLGAVFIPLLVLGMIFQEIEIGAGLFFPFILVACALLPPLWSVAWMIPGASASGTSDPGDAQVSALTWRRGLFAFMGGGTISAFAAIVLEILLPVMILSLVTGLADPVRVYLRAAFRSLAGTDVAYALTSRSFIYLFVQLVILAPLAEEMAKPLVTLPLLRSLGKKEAFWMGALAGAGFAALENVIYATSGLRLWAGILVVRALGGALHPLCTGLVAQGWWSVLRREPEAGKNWLKRFGMAVALHAAWNGGSLLVVILGSARFFGVLPPRIGLLGISAAGTTLAFLILLGLFALWIGRAYGHDRPILSVEEQERGVSVSSDQALAVWALACLIAILPLGIAGLKLWLR